MVISMMTGEAEVREGGQMKSMGGGREVRGKGRGTRCDTEEETKGQGIQNDRDDGGCDDEDS